MTVLAPVFLIAAAGAILLLLGLHLITRHRPPRAPFPTARFVPESAARITARSLRLSDAPLLLLRALVLALAGSALAGIVLTPKREPVARVVLVDGSRAVASAAEARDSAAAYLGAGDALVLFDGAARVIVDDARDSLASLAISPERGSLSAALVAGLRTAGALLRRADSVELVLVSPAAVEEVDAATSELRALHTGRIRLVMVRPAVPAEVRWPPEVRGVEDDPLRAALALTGPVTPRTAGTASNDSASAAVRIVRDSLGADDVRWAKTGGVLVHWPVLPAPAWAKRPRIDSAGAVLAGEGVVLATLRREVDPPPGLVVARWGDGSPAATEERLGSGCVRHVAVPVPAAGDVVLRPAFGAFVRAIAAACGGPARLEPLDSGALAMMAGDGPLFASLRLGRGQSRSQLTPWLLALALVGALLELPLRRRSRS